MLLKTADDRAPDFMALEALRRPGLLHALSPGRRATGEAIALTGAQISGRGPCRDRRPAVDARSVWPAAVPMAPFPGIDDPVQGLTAAVLLETPSRAE